MRPLLTLIHGVNSMQKIFETLEVKEGRDLSDVYNHGQWYSKHTRGRHSQHYAYFVKPACGWIPPTPSRLPPSIQREFCSRSNFESQGRP